MKSRDGLGLMSTLEHTSKRDSQNLQKLFFFIDFDMHSKWRRKDFGGPVYRSCAYTYG
jgi:hypothetical protein